MMVAGFSSVTFLSLTVTFPFATPWRRVSGEKMTFSSVKVTFSFEKVTFTTLKVTFTNEKVTSTNEKCKEMRKTVTDSDSC